VEVTLEADGAILDFVPAETDPETPRDRLIPGTLFSAAGYRVSLTEGLVLGTHSSDGSRGNSGQDGSDDQS